MKVLGLIPARGGSKGIFRKNIKNLCGKPLIAWTIEAALKSSKIDRLVVTTEDNEIAEIAKSYGADVPFMRPTELAEDSTPGISPVLHAIEQLPNFDSVLLLQPTSPLRTSTDIDGILNFGIQEDAESVVSVCESPVHPYWIYKSKNKILKPFFDHKFVACRQDLPDAFSLNGAMYFGRTSWLLDQKAFVSPYTYGYLMPKSRSYDIDDEDDWLVVETLLSLR
ncbi:acylneuraminate cytidylyltransferase family protein [Opitutales bacterium]|nr:acylneuraminate cytidylyltransferase family protein [Opitutales bacterium]